MRPLYALIFILISSLFFQCAKEKAAPIVAPPINICDSISTVSYMDDIVPILTDNQCFSCHANGFSPFFNDYSTVYGLRDSILLTIKHNVSIDPTLDPMPQGLPKIEDTLINKVQCWIESGAPNN